MYPNTEKHLKIHPHTQPREIHPPAAQRYTATDNKQNTRTHTHTHTHTHTDRHTEIHTHKPKHKDAHKLNTLTQKDTHVQTHPDRHVTHTWKCIHPPTHMVRNPPTIHTRTYSRSQTLNLAHDDAPKISGIRWIFVRVSSSKPGWKISATYALVQMCALK